MKVEIEHSQYLLLEAVKRMEQANLDYQNALREYNSAAKNLNECAQSVSSFLAGDPQRKP